MISSISFQASGTNDPAVPSNTFSSECNRVRFLRNS